VTTHSPNTPAPLDPAAIATRCPRCGANPGYRCLDLRAGRAHTGNHSTVDRVHRIRYDYWLTTPAANALADIAIHHATAKGLTFDDHGRPAGDPRLRADLVSAAAHLLGRIIAIDRADDLNSAAPSRRRSSTRSDERPSPGVPGPPEPSQAISGPRSSCLVHPYGDCRAIPEMCGDIACTCCVDRHDQDQP